jgi:23S rRNA (uracil1939-C5)-methyltransferase
MVFRHVVELTAADRRALGEYQRNVAARVLLQPGNYTSIVDIDGNVPRPLHYRLDRFGVALAFHPADFVQVNAAVNQDLVTTAVDWLDVQPRERIADLFCGIGNFTLPLARRGAYVLGVEGADELVQRARTNAEMNGLAMRASFATADLYADPVEPAVEHVFDGVTKVLLDPPRTGAGAVLAKLAGSSVERIAYVSCHPVSFARDAAVLRKIGFRLAAVRVFDMFPHTTHVETLGAFERTW